MLEIGTAFKSPLIKESISLLLQECPRIIFLFQVQSLQMTIKNITERKPDLLIIDYKLIQDTYCKLQDLKDENSECKIILFLNEPPDKAISLQAVNGIIHKNINSKKLKNILTRLEQNDILLQEKEEWQNEFNFKKNSTSNFEITPREKQILKLLIKGKTSNKKIASHLNISPNTVANHLNNLFQKITVHNKTQAVIETLKNNIVSSGGKINA